MVPRQYSIVLRRFSENTSVQSVNRNLIIFNYRPRFCGCSPRGLQFLSEPHVRVNDYSEASTSTSFCVVSLIIEHGTVLVLFSSLYNSLMIPIDHHHNHYW